MEVVFFILTKNRRKQPKITRNQSAFRDFEAHSKSAASLMPPARRSDMEYAECAQ